MTRREQRGIDIRRLRIVQKGPVVRFELRVARVRLGPNLTQRFLITLEAADQDFPVGQIVLATHARGTPRPRDDREHQIVLEGTDTPQGFRQCRRLAYSLRDGAQLLWIELPRRCLPRGRVLIDAHSQTSSAIKPRTFLSSDDLATFGPRDLGGTVGPHPDA